MTDFVEELYVEALLAAQGCPEILVKRTLATAMVEFYRTCKAWRFTTDTIGVIRGDRVVDLDLPAGTYVGQIYWAKLDGKLLTAISERNLTDAIGTPMGYAMPAIGKTVLLNCLPEESYITNGLVANVALQPMSTLTELPTELFDLHRDGILFGAISKLLAMPNVSWSNLNGSITYANMGMQICAEAKRQAESNQAPIVRVVRYGGIQ